MRINIRHETSYTYAEPARSALQLLRLTPRSTESQFVRRWRVEVDADARLDRSEDAFGNITHLIYLKGPLESVHIVVEGEADTTDSAGFVRGTSERLPVGFFLRGTDRTAASPEIQALARDISASEGGDPLAALHRLNAELTARLTFRTDATSAGTTAAEAFEARSGVCQDFAQIFIAAARTLAIPSRYVSGYLLMDDREDQEAGHAWAEAHVHGLGWIGFDPAHGHCITERYVRVAVGADSNDAAPVRGAQFGGVDEALGVAISVRQGRAIVEG